MKQASNLKIKLMEQNHECRFCGKKFHKDITLATHMCVKKRRFVDLESAGSRYGFRTFQRFFEITAAGKKLKSTAEFIDSPYYIGFVKFGNYIALLKPLHPDQFIDFVIRNGVSLKDWTKDFVYETYIENLIKTEPASSATDRTITNIAEWCEKNSTQFNRFFYDVSANEAAYMIRTGKISPWVLYLAETGGELMSRFNKDHSKMFSEMIDASYWMKIFKKNTDDVEFIRSLLEQAGL